MSERAVAHTCAAVLVAVGIAAARGAAAQDCAEGRERVEGRCCWPGQTFSEERGRCEGAPRCPPTLVEHGEACVAAAAAAAPGAWGGGPIGVPAWPTGVTPAAGSSTADWPRTAEAEHPPRARALRGRGEDEGLIVAALAVFDVGWILGWLGAFFDELSDGGASWVFSFTPLVGGMIGGLVDLGPSRGFSVGAFACGIPSIILQGIGLFVLMPIAFANETTETVLQPLDLGGGATARLEASAPGSDAGLSLRIEL